jgi:hypothetical protein
MTKLNPPAAFPTRPAFGSTGGGGGAFGSTGGGGAGLASPGWACGEPGAPGAGAGDAVVGDGGAGSGSALDVAGNAMLTAKALVIAALASAAHSPLRRVEFGSTCSMATNLPRYGCDARVPCGRCDGVFRMLPMCNLFHVDAAQ